MGKPNSIKIDEVSAGIGYGDGSGYGDGTVSKERGLRRNS